MKIETSKKAKVTPQSVVHTTQKAKIDTSMSDLVMDMLSKIYTKPLIAAIREYVSNGVDSHTAIGQTKPVEVVLPTAEMPHLSIKDYGRGMDMFDILTIYGNFGTSDKRESNEFIGGFGIGSKSGLAISNVIEVESVKDGVLNRFRVKREGQEIVTQFVIENLPAPNQESGTRIDIPVKANYVNEIQSYNHTDKYYLNSTSTSTIRGYIDVLAGWSKNQVIAKCDNTSIAHLCNDYRIPDTYRELENAFITNTTVNGGATWTHRGFLVGNVFYSNISAGRDIFKEKEVNDATWEGFNQPTVLKLDIAKTKVAYSREQIEFDGSDETRKYVIDKFKMVRQEIKDIVEQISNTPNITAAEYIKRIISSGIDIQFATDAYSKFLKKNSRFKLEDAIDITSNIYVMEFNIDHNGSCNISTNRWAGRNSRFHEFVQDKIVVVTEPNEKEKSSKTYFRYIKDAYDYFTQTGHDANGCMALIKNAYEHKNANAFSYRYHGLLIAIMSQENLNKYAFKDFATVIKMRDIAEIIKQRRKVERQTNVTDKNIRLYTYEIRRIGSNLTNLKDIPANANICVLPVKSAYAFNTQTSNLEKSIIVELLNIDILCCVRNNNDYDSVKIALPNAWFATDDEIEKACEKVVEKYAWVARDKFCSTWTSAISNNNINYVDDQYVMFGTNASTLIDTYLKTVNDMPNNPAQMSRLLNDIAVYKDKSELMKKLHDIAEQTDAAGPQHKVTRAFRVGTSLVYAGISMITLDEAKQFMRDIASDYTDEIQLLKRLY